MFRNRCVYFAAALALSSSLLAEDVVRVEQGQLAGTTGADAKVRVFKGVPFAAAPVGDLRWKAPKTPAAWQGVRAVKDFSPQCEQAGYPQNSLYYQPPQPSSEDCLYLNVWTTAKANEKRPVMVWIHGGALTRGAGSIPMYDGEELAKKGVVLVTINYRLNIFGYFAHPDLTKESDRNSSGNYGILDQVAALDWVKRNIGAFGGDPNKVTIFGESAGSWSVNLLVATPLAKGLFQRAIGESGAQFQQMPKLAELEQQGSRLAGKNSISDLRAKSAEDILKMGANSAGVSVDGYLLPADVYTIFAEGKQNDVAVLIGSNADEGTSLAPWSPNATAESFEQRIKAQFKDRAADAFKVFPAGTLDEAKSSHYALLRDQVFGWQMRTWARMQEKTGKSKAYLYYFSRIPPQPESDRYKAYHAAEIQYAFGTYNRERAQDTDRKLSHTMMTYWVNFATTGDPNGKGAPKWPAYQAKNDMAMELGDTVKMVPVPNKASLDFFDSWFAGQRAK